MAYRRIVVAAALQRYLDFTPIAVRIRDLGADLAGLYGISIHILSVDAPVELLPGVETTDEKLDRFAAPLRQRGLEVVTCLRDGRPSRAIEEYVDEVGADLVIMGSHSKRGPIDVGLGSTASAIGRDLVATVLLVRPTAAEQAGAQELMIPKYPLVFPYG
jgi:nucleotide-binding universal stress UspA family protein